MASGKLRHMEEDEESLIRILSTDIRSGLSLYAGLTRIKGVSWAFSNALCYLLKLDKSKKIADVSKEEIGKIEAFLKNPKLPTWLLNRRKDRETGEDKHNLTNDLDLTKEWDIRRMKKIKSYKGWRHALGQPVRGQRTKGHFREKGKAVGVRRVKGAKK